MSKILEKATKQNINHSYPIINRLPCLIYQISTGKLFVCYDVPDGGRVSLVEKMLTNIFTGSMVFTTNEDKVEIQELILTYEESKLINYGLAESMVLTESMAYDFIVEKLSTVKDSSVLGEQFKHIEDAMVFFKDTSKDINATLNKKHCIRAYLESTINNREAVALLRSKDNKAEVLLHDLESMLDKLNFACYFDEKTLEVKIVTTMHIDSIFRHRKIPFVFKLEPTVTYVDGIELTSYKVV